MISKHFITTPIYYVNADPHIGHLYTTIIADALTRFYRQTGHPTYFLTGTDEHGIKVARAAQARGLSPQDHVDDKALIFQGLFKRYGLIFDRFIRTTDSDHKQAALHLWNTLKEKGHIYKGVYKGWYAAQDECFYTEKELINGKAPTGAYVEFVEEESYYFRLSHFQKPLEELFANNPSFVQPKERYNEALAFIKQGLCDLSISRASVSWGIPVPDNPEHTIYVWIDALCNYITALGYPHTHTEHFTDFWQNSMHIIGKDILRFHAIFWPAFLMAAELPTPKAIVAHGWWIKKGSKMSKSTGNVIDPHSLLDKYDSDAIRYFLLREAPFNRDGDFSEEALITRAHTDLANNLGNLVLRVISLFLKHKDTLLQDTGYDTALTSQAYALAQPLIESMHDYRLTTFCERLWSFISECNRYVDREQPWTLAKEKKHARLTSVLFSCLECIRCIALYITPILPKTADKILNALCVPQSERSWLCARQESAISSSSTITSPGVLFTKYID